MLAKQEKKIMTKNRSKMATRIACSIHNLYTNQRTGDKSHFSSKKMVLLNKNHLLIILAGY